jgi:hypothetical protein
MHSAHAKLWAHNAFDNQREMQVLDLLDLNEIIEDMLRPMCINL